MARATAAFVHTCRVIWPKDPLPHHPHHPAPLRLRKEAAVHLMDSSNDVGVVKLVKVVAMEEIPRFAESSSAELVRIATVVCGAHPESRNDELAHVTGDVEPPSIRRAPATKRRTPLLGVIPGCVVLPRGLLHHHRPHALLPRQRLLPR
jgi:hypothetical protein